MSGLQLVPDERAGSAALGILVPPGTPTILIVRPRSLSWDLLLVQGMAGTAFRQMDRIEALSAARSFFEALQKWSHGGPGHVGAVASAGGHLVWVDVEEFCLVACERLPGRPYRPTVFAKEEEAQRAAARVAAILHPAPDSTQEVYFNTRHFER